MSSQAQPALPARRLIGLLALVALLHAWVLALLADRMTPPPGAAIRSRVSVWTRVVPEPAQRRPAAAAPRLLPAARPDPAPRPAREASPARPQARLPAAPAPPPQASAAGVAPVTDADSPTRGESEPPPVYPTKVPASANLRFAARANGVATDAELRWRHDGERYRLELHVAGANRPLVEQLSEGGFDAAGLAPERFVDRRRGRSVGAAHFRRDIGRIDFSGPSVDYPAWPGAQDRLAWLAQLVAVLAAAPQPPEELRFFVADARGVARAWIFRADGRERLDTAAGPVDALRLVREPPRANDLRITVWFDPAQRTWPLRLRWTVPISGYDLDLTLVETPGADPLPAAPAASGP